MNINFEKLRKWAKEKGNKITSSPLFQSFIIKGIALLIIWTLGLIPFWFSLLLWWLLEPQTFWQILITTVVLLITFGSVQGFLLFLLFFFTIFVFTEPV